MLQISFTGQFKKDFKICKKRGYDMSILQSVIDILSIPDTLPPKNRVHMLSGNCQYKMECHILPNWLLIYTATDTELMLYRTGTHSDLFNNYIQTR